MEKINVTQLRQHLPDYLKKVSRGVSLQITNHGKVIARLMPEKEQSQAAQERLIALRGSMIMDDIIKPIGDQGWTADENNL